MLCSYFISFSQFALLLLQLLAHSLHALLIGFIHLHLFLQLSLGLHFLFLIVLYACEELLITVSLSLEKGKCKGTSPFWFFLLMKTLCFPPHPHPLYGPTSISINQSFQSQALYSLSLAKLVSYRQLLNGREMKNREIEPENYWTDSKQIVN